MRNFSKRSLLSFVKFQIIFFQYWIYSCIKIPRLKSFRLLHRLCKMGSWKAPSCGSFHSSPVLTAVSVSLHGLYTYQGLSFCVPSFSWDAQPEKSWRWYSCFLLREREPYPTLFNICVSLLPCRMSHEQYYAMLFLTVKGHPTLLMKSNFENKSTFDLKQWCIWKY